ncbi:MAG: hypothetical protein HYR96_01850 [Deltaproteobacteria bacterium]|nr:hypothetical protein [Deltaproteobacteria bacterium]MBI3295810.1 hypothetical protein [Deltaproteobacteria bacterium]
MLRNRRFAFSYGVNLVFGAGFLLGVQAEGTYEPIYTTRIVINGAQSTRVPDRKLIFQTFDKYASGAYANPEQARAHAFAIQKARELHLEKAPFFFEWAVSSNGTLLGDVAIVTQEGFYSASLSPLVDPESTEKGASPISITEMESRLMQGSLTPEEALRSILTLPPADVECLTVNGQLDFKDDRLDKIAAGLKVSSPSQLEQAGQKVLRKIVQEMRRDQRLALFQNQGSRNECLAPIAESAWTELKSLKRASLAWDFQHYLKQLNENRNHLEFVGETHSHTPDANRPELRLWLRFTAALVLELKPNEFVRYLPRPLRESLARDTNSPDVETRKEPIDIVTYFVSQDRFSSWLTATDMDTVHRNAIVRAAIQHTLAPESYLPEITVVKEHLAEGGTPYRLFCSGAEIEGAPHKGSRPDPLVSYVVLTQQFLRGGLDKPRFHNFMCGPLGASLETTIEKLRVPLHDPIDSHFIVGKDKKIKAISTFPIISEVNAQFIGMLRAGLILQGYTEADQVRSVANLHDDFLAEMLEADLYFPMYSGPGGSEMHIGVNGSHKLRMRRQHKGVEIELILYVPPQRNAQSIVPKTSASVSETEMFDLFRRRRALDVERRLTILNIVCGSVGHIPAWMRFYKLSIPEEPTEEVLARLPGEVPIVIGAQRSFNSNSLEEWTKYAQYPFTAMVMSAEEAPVTDLLKYLEGEKFAPGTALGDALYFDQKAQDDRITIHVLTQMGTRLTFQ